MIIKMADSVMPISFQEKSRRGVPRAGFSGSSSAELRLRRQIKEHETRMIWG
jgi:hypothetical protein